MGLDIRPAERRVGAWLARPGTTVAAAMGKENDVTTKKAIRAQLLDHFAKGVHSLYWLLEQFERGDAYDIRAALETLRSEGKAKVYEDHSGTGFGMLDVWGPAR